MPIILEQTERESLVFSDTWKSYDRIVDFDYKKHYRIIHRRIEYVRSESDVIDGKFVEITNHINGIENFC